MVLMFLSLMLLWEQLCQLLDGEFADRVHDYAIIDCRFPYEYEGGHIRGAINVSRRTDIERLYMVPVSPERQHPLVMVFHCEFSSKRAPTMYVIRLC